ncbi:hypothetical protein ACWCO0_14755 [Streptomyces tubercidicus]
MTVQETGPLTTSSGALVADSRKSEQVGVGGTPSGRDQVLLETPARARLRHRPRRERLASMRHVDTWRAADRISRSVRRGHGRQG